MTGYRAQNLYLPVTALVTAATGGGMTIPRIPANLQNSDNDSTTGGFKIGHYLNDDVLLYVSTESGYRSPGATISPVAINPSLITFEEEESDMTEIGMKGTFMDGRLRLNAAYYDYSFDGYQTKWDNISARVYTVQLVQDLFSKFKVVFSIITMLQFQVLILSMRMLLMLI